MRWLQTIPVYARAVIIILMAMFCFDIMGAIIKHLGGDYPAQQLSFLRNVFGLVPTIIVLVLSREWHSAGRPLYIRNWRLALLRGLMVTFAQFSYYSALSHMEFATVNTLAFVSPMFVTALSIPILGIKVGIWRWLAVGIGFSGVIMVMQPGSTIFSMYTFFPIAAAFGYALSAVTVRKIDVGVSSATINLYSTVSALVGAYILMATTSGFVPIASTEDWLWIIAMGSVGGCAVLLLVTAYRLTQPSTLAPFEYFGIPISFVIGFYIFDEAPFDALFPGALLIVFGGFVIIWRERLKSKLGAQKPTSETIDGHSKTNGN
jgi:drug/metabolite transporter (DMT)-like permease